VLLDLTHQELETIARARRGLAHAERWFQGAAKHWLSFRAT
jgi:hypothetical protein